MSHGTGEKTSTIKNDTKSIAVNTEFISLFKILLHNKGYITTDYQLIIKLLTNLKIIQKGWNKSCSTIVWRNKWWWWWWWYEGKTKNGSSIYEIR